ncbi:MAG: DUF5683 domain-containing protein [Candidatus Cloacimonadales bacterium]
MMRKFAIVAFSLLILASVSAQEISVKKAMLMSAVMPGWGQAYIQNYTKTGFFLAAEVGTYLAWARLSQETDWAIAAYKDYAQSMVGADPASDKEYFQLIQDNFSSSQYNDSVERYARNVYLIINNDPQGYDEYLENYLIPEEASWDWENRANWDRYKDLRYTKQNYEVYENFAVAALILNRLISVVDVAVSARRLDKGKAGSALNNLQISPDFAKDGMRISYEIKF